MWSTACVQKSELFTGPAFPQGVRLAQLSAKPRRTTDRVSHRESRRGKGHEAALLPWTQIAGNGRGAGCSRKQCWPAPTNGKRQGRFLTIVIVGTSPACRVSTRGAHSSLRETVRRLKGPARRRWNIAPASRNRSATIHLYPETLENCPHEKELKTFGCFGQTLHVCIIDGAVCVSGASGVRGTKS